MVATTEVYMDKQEKELNLWLKRHADTVVIMVGILGSFLWMTGKINDIEKKLIRIETVLIMKGIMPPDIAMAEKK